MSEGPSDLGRINQPVLFIMGAGRSNMQSPHAHPHLIHIVVEVDGHARPVQFDHSPVTGREIREKAGVPLDDDLTRLVHGKPSGGPIGLDDTVEIANGDKFLAVPRGRVS